MDNALLIIQFCLAAAAGNQPVTVYHDRIDGLLLTEEDACWL